MMWLPSHVWISIVDGTSERLLGEAYSMCIVRLFSADPNVQMGSSKLRVVALLSDELLIDNQ